jgi:hypothetical protein
MTVCCQSFNSCYVFKHAINWLFICTLIKHFYFPLSEYGAVDIRQNRCTRRPASILISFCEKRRLEMWNERLLVKMLIVRLCSPGYSIYWTPLNETVVVKTSLLNLESMRDISIMLLVKPHYVHARIFTCIE